MIVVVSTYAPRRAWLAQLLRDLAAQTRPPEHVVVLDDAPQSAPWDLPPPGLLVHRIANPTRLGPAERWRFIARYMDHAQDGDEIVAVIDDDVVLGPRYLELSARWVEAVEGACSWYPLTPEEERVHAPGVIIPVLAGGLTTLRGGWLYGLLAHPETAAGLAWESCDGAFISWWLWREGIPIVRPTGWREVLSLRDSPLEETRAAVYGDFSPMMNGLRERTGWQWNTPARPLLPGEWPK